jgi:hypothetical protein
MHRFSRRSFLSTALLGAASSVVALVLPRTLRAAPTRVLDEPHPTPRPGITAAKIPTRAQLEHAPDAIPVFDLVREIPEIVDGIRCHCGCAERKEFYSLLSCYEGSDAMAMHCEVCQGQGRLVARLHKAGKSLDEIRKGIDARFG